MVRSHLSLLPLRLRRTWPRRLGGGFAICIAGWMLVSGGAFGQSPGESKPVRTLAETPVPKSQLGIDFFDLLVRGGIFMIPIGVTSLVVATFILDRWIGLRRSRLLPGDFRKLTSTAIRSGAVDPRQMYRLCNESDSAAARIAREGVVRAGRPQPEITAAVAEAAQREADRAYANVRWLNLGAGIAPLLGLLGTVWGLIQAFHDTTQLTPAQLASGQNRADFLAVGIYEALVTTLAGLIVAIPAAVASHYFEGKITHIFRQIEELMADLVRSLEPYEGKTRFDVIGRDLVPRDIAPPSLLGMSGPGKSVSAPPVARRVDS